MSGLRAATPVYIPSVKRKKNLLSITPRSIETRHSRGTPRANVGGENGRLLKSRTAHLQLGIYDRGRLILLRRKTDPAPPPPPLTCTRMSDLWLLRRAILSRPRPDERASLPLTQRTARSEDVYSRYESFREAAQRSVPVSLVRARRTCMSLCASTAGIQIFRSYQ